METLETDDFTIRELRQIVVKASRANPHLTSRLEKAAFLVLLRTIEPLGDHHFQIRSEDGAGGLFAPTCGVISGLTGPDSPGSGSCHIVRARPEPCRSCASIQ